MKFKNMAIGLALLASTPIVAKNVTEQTTCANEAKITNFLAKKHVRGCKDTCSKTYRNLDAFSRIYLEINSADVEYRQNPVGETIVKVEVSENLSDLVEVTSREGELVVRYKDKYEDVKVHNSHLKIVVCSPSLSSITIYGRANVTLRGVVCCDSLYFDIYGLVDVEAHSLVCEYVSVNSSGIGDVELAGTAKHAHLSLEGCGEISTERLLCQYVNASINGVGNIDCYATDNLAVSVDGIGRVSYSGTPKVTKEGYIKHVKHK